MAEQWKALATTHTQALISATELHLGPLGPSFRDATVSLQRRTGNLSRLNRGEVVPWQEFYTGGADTMLRDASRNLALYNDLLKRLVRVFSIYGQTLGVLTDGPLWTTYLNAGPQADERWQTWVQHRAASLDNPDLVFRSFRLVAVYNIATLDAILVAQRFPENSASRTAWMRAAEAIARRADEVAGQTSRSQSYMRHAVSAFCSACSAILLQ